MTTTYHLCMCRNSWPASQADLCPRCGGEPVQTVEREHVAKGLDVDTSPNGTQVSTVDLYSIEPGVYLDGELVVDDDFDRLMDRAGFTEDEEAEMEDERPDGFGYPRWLGGGDDW